MKHTIICFCLFLSLAITSSIFAEDGYFGFGSNPEDFSGKIFENLYITPGDCSEDIRFENITVTGDVLYSDTGSSGHSLSFFNSSLNRAEVTCLNLLLYQY